jgi:1-aminocyclopropane-1-carboxylate deaminase/D-cysteine desulfhydrase-like pyridoxal-dependent ACC family enzyme
MGARLFVKRDDALSFGLGGNKVRKLMLETRAALDEHADTLITCGGIQSNHCRATAAAAARLGMHCYLVLDGEPPPHPTGNLFLDQLFGAEIVYVSSRAERRPRMDELAAELRAKGRRPYVIPLGASTPLGALALARAVGELPAQGIAPDFIVVATSSGGTQAGLIAGCALYGLPTRVIGISADDPADTVRSKVAGILTGLESLLELEPGTLQSSHLEVDDAFVGEGYGLASAASRQAQLLAARKEALVTEHWYTAKALAGLVARAKSGAFLDNQTVVFWHTGGVPAIFV